MSTVTEAAEAQRIAYTRQEDWFNPLDHPNSHVTIVGVGGVGSPTALALAKLGISELTLIDPDTVERHNLPNQMFPLYDFGGDIGVIGEYKVDVAQELLFAMSPGIVGAIPGRITSEGWDFLDPNRATLSRLHGVVVTGPDNMQARSDLWHTQVKYNPYVPIFLDARMGGQNLTLYSVNPCDPDDIAYYESKLYSDEQASSAPCTAAAVIDVGFAIASLITRAVRRHYAGEERERLIFLDQANLVFGKE